MTNCPHCNRRLTGDICSVHGYVGPAAAGHRTAVDASASADLTGEVRMFAGATAPARWLLCQGQAVSRTTYKRLFAVIGTSYGAGDGTTTFNLPNMEGNVPAGMKHDDAAFHELGHSGGAAAVTLTAAQSGIPAHGHNIMAGTALGGANYGTFAVGTTSSSGPQGSDISGGGPTNAAEAHTNLQPYLCLNFIIRI